MIPESVRLWHSEKKYPALLIDNLNLFERGEMTLECKGAPCRNLSTHTPIERSLSSWVSFAVFENRGTKKSGNYAIDVVARAELVPPYLGITRK